MILSTVSCVPQHADPSGGAAGGASVGIEFIDGSGDVSAPSISHETPPVTNVDTNDASDEGPVQVEPAVPEKTPEDATFTDVGSDNGLMESAEPESPDEQIPNKSDENSVSTVSGSQNIKFGYSVAQSAPAFSGFNKVPDEKCIYYADQILNGTLFVSMIMEGYPFGDLSELDWNVSFTTSPNTFLLYMQGLTPLEVLSRAFQLTSDVRYLEYGVSLIESWITYSLDEELTQGNIYLWNDHGSAIRAESLLYFMLVSENTPVDTPELRTLIFDQLVAHAQFLANDVNYTKNHNHGIIQDIALLHTAYFLDHPDSLLWINTGVERLKEQLAFAFNSEMIHVENSPGYNAAVIDLFYEIGRFLEDMQNPDGEFFVSCVYDAAEFLGWVMMPNGILPQMGDTIGSQTLEGKTLKYVKFGNERLNFTSSLGTWDEMTEDQKRQTVKYYPDAGYFFYRENWDADQVKDATWKLFKAGYSSRTHKHADDTTFMLYSKGYEIFGDSGMYNYMSGTLYRNYMISSSAHNVVTVDERSYSPTVENAGKTGMLFYNNGENMDAAAAFNNMYWGVEMDRYFYSSGDLTVLHDNILSEEDHTYSQLFHLSENIHIVSQSDQETVLRIADTGYLVRMRQMLPVQLEVLSGRTDGQPAYGHMSRGLNQIQDIHTSRFVQNASDADYITVITIEDENGMVALKNGTMIHTDEIMYDAQNNRLCVGEDMIPFTERNRPSFDTEIEIDSEAKVTVTVPSETEFQYAWYVVRADDAKAVQKTGFSSGETFVFDLSGLTGDVFLKGYVQSPDYPQRKSEIVCAFVYDSTTQQYHVDNGEKYPYLNLNYQGHHIEQISSSMYRFVLDYEYSWTTTQRWYVYRNGAYYTVLQTRNQPVLEFEFTEPGDYTVSYYFRTPNGDYEFWDFDIVSIP